MSNSITSQGTAHPGRYKVMIVDDHPIVRFGLGQMINREPDMEVCGEADGVVDALRQIEASRPDVIVIDLSLGSEDGIELIEHAKARWSTMKILVSSAHDEQTYAGRVLRAGAMGYISKHEPMSMVVAAIRQVLGGEVYLSPEMATAMLQRAAVGKTLDGDPVATLSNRELQVFKMIGQGLSTIEIAHKLELSPKTVESHRKVIKVKLNLANGPQLNRHAFQWIQEGH